MKQYIKILLREGLLTEITSREAWDKFYSDATKFPLLKGDVNLFNKIEDLYPKNGNQHNRGYFMWIYKQLKNGLKEEDFYKVKEYLRLFVKFINRIDSNKRDISKYNTIQDLYSVVKDFENNEDDITTSKTSEIKKIKEEELDLVFSNSSWSVYVPLTERASCLIGKGTQWCTAAEKSNNMFDHYNGQGKLYVLINKDDNSKYQLHFESNQLMDENDREVAASYFFDYAAEDNDLYEFLKGVNDNFYQFILETSVEDVSRGGYSETFNEALQAYHNGGGDVPQNILRTLRSGDDSYSVYLGYIYEKEPDNINGYDIETLFDNRYVESEDMNRIIEHLIDIGFDDFGDEYQTIYNAYKQLVGAKLELNNNYQIDNDRVLKIVGIDNDDDEKPFKVSVRGKGGESNSGNIGFEALKNLLYNKSLFEVRNKLKGI
jgi:hypothetical protein